LLQKAGLSGLFYFSLLDYPCGTIPAFFIHKGQKMDKRFVQAHKEARWALWLTLLYLAAWLVTAYLPDSVSVYRPAALV
jgi:hypothetical protein